MMVLSSSHHSSKRLGEGLSRLGATLPHNPPQPSGCPSATKYSAEDLPRTDAGAPRPESLRTSLNMGAEWTRTQQLHHTFFTNRIKKVGKPPNGSNLSLLSISGRFSQLFIYSLVTPRTLRCCWPLSGVNPVNRRWPGQPELNSNITSLPLLHRNRASIPGLASRGTKQRPATLNDLGHRRLQLLPGLDGYGASASTTARNVRGAPGRCGLWHIGGRSAICVRARRGRSLTTCMFIPRRRELCRFLEADGAKAVGGRGCELSLGGGVPVCGRHGGVVGFGGWHFVSGLASCDVREGVSWLGNGSVSRKYTPVSSGGILVLWRAIWVLAACCCLADVENNGLVQSFLFV